MKAEFSALGVRVRAITAQHGDILAMLRTRNCDLDFVEMVVDPDFSICKDYMARGLDLILDTEERPMLLKSLVKNGEFPTEEAAKHNMVQPAIVVEDSERNIIYTWTWYDLKGDQKWGGKTNSPTVFLRPTTDSLMEAIKAESYVGVEIDTYPSKWPREKFPYIDQLAGAKAKL